MLSVSLMFNHLLRDRDLTKYNEIQDGEKIKYLMMKIPNPTGENVCVHL